MKIVFKEDFIKQIIKEVINVELKKKQLRVPIGISNRHIHLNQSDMEILFGIGYKLSKYRDLIQPNHYAAKEVVHLKTQKNCLKNIRVLGPVRPYTQIELSVTDSRFLGINPPVRESGKIKGTPGITILGPKGTLKKEYGVIVPQRHIHMPKKIAFLYGYKDGQKVDLEFDTDRGGVLKNTLIRVSDKYVLECHIDTDEANGLSIENKHMAKIIRNELKNHE